MLTLPWSLRIKRHFLYLEILNLLHRHRKWVQRRLLHLLRFRQIRPESIQISWLLLWTRRLFNIRVGDIQLIDLHVHHIGVSVFFVLGGQVFEAEELLVLVALREQWGDVTHLQLLLGLVGLEVQFWGLLEWVVGVVVGDGFEAELVHGGVVLREFLLEYLIFKESLIVHPTKLALPKLSNYLRPKNNQQLYQPKILT